MMQNVTFLDASSLTHFNATPFFISSILGLRSSPIVFDADYFSGVASVHFSFFAEHAAFVTYLFSACS